eukprot:CAMPEP_0206436476 /NCGR_PEP_ID=MMETSP0324_2-20121206/10502_1 /ASSEMBLY_ACC=CAM_ASM_000836 /TAXON_ID=2866 /ORGANISM="Crypthecodinium cohnii, Strain Seligo" /LENGTH=636 /DNA_ID=CAMNT_0053903641 /DNA_START=48 /DNA_END=1960 /DNA_ORIENTATION=+
MFPAQIARRTVQQQLRRCSSATTKQFSSSSSSSSSSSTAPADFLLCASPGSARRRRLGTAVSTLLTLGVGVSIAGLTFLADDSRRLCEASRDRRHVSCFFSPRHMMELLKDMYFQCDEDSVACGIQCMSKSSGEVCCPNNLGSSTVCAPNSECCDGLCAVPGTMCADVCSPGLISCGGTCLVGTEEDTCCVGPSGAGIVCAPGAECCNGLCMDEGQGCASECDPGLVSCGGVCLPGNSSDQCCLGPTGSGILCEASAECCDGICLQDGHGCAKTCAPGMVPCGGLCLPGQGEDICCMGPSGSGILCNSDAQCCEGICVMGGQGCSSPCGAGLIKCGGLCLPGSPDAQCCLGASGNGILCGPNSTCCDGLCMLEGQGCSKTCAEGLIQCGGECLPSLDISSNNSSSNNNNNNDIDATNVAGSCCVGPEGRGILCTPDAECCSGLCMAKGQGCADTCGEGLVKCGSTCLPGLLTDKCCLNSDGVGLLCDGDDECCDGLCIAAGSSCGTACRKGMMLCGNECLVGDPTKANAAWDLAASVSSAKPAQSAATGFALKKEKAVLVIAAKGRSSAEVCAYLQRREPLAAQVAAVPEAMAPSTPEQSERANQQQQQQQQQHKHKQQRRQQQDEQQHRQYEASP